MEDTNSSFVFETVTTEKFEEIITNLNIRNAVQSGYLFSRYTATTINRRLKFDQSMKETDEQKNQITDPLAFFQMFPKFMKDAYTSKSIPILIKYFLKINSVFVKG